MIGKLWRGQWAKMGAKVENFFFELSQAWR